MNAAEQNEKATKLEKYKIYKTYSVPKKNRLTPSSILIVLDSFGSLNLIDLIRLNFMLLNSFSISAISDVWCRSISLDHPKCYELVRLLSILLYYFPQYIYCQLFQQLQRLLSRYFISFRLAAVWFAVC